jgi:serpin B
MKNISIVLIVLMLSAISCELLRKENPIGPNLRTLASYEQELSNVSTAFAIDLFHQIEKSGADNYFFSPYSIHQMLSMAMNGNEGEVAKEFLQSLKYD